eukprot:c29679_g1_i1 orf=701-1087(-)
MQYVLNWRISSRIGIRLCDHIAQTTAQSLQFQARNSMQSFLMKAKIIHDQLLAIHSALSSSQLAALVLTKLPTKYDVIAKALRLQVTKNQLNFDDLTSLWKKKPSCSHKANCVSHIQPEIQTKHMLHR